MLSQEYLADRKAHLQNKLFYIMSQEENPQASSVPVNSLTNNPRFAKIKNALQRIEDGSYGYCESCQQEIEPQRLNYLPETPFCFACAKLKS